MLEAVVDGQCPLCFLASANIEEIFNKPGHGLDRASVGEALERLFARGLIEMWNQSEVSRSTPPTRCEIEATLDELGPWDNPNCTYYGFTPEGGTQWEMFASPNWDQFADGWSRPSQSGRSSFGTRISSTRSRLDRWLEGAYYAGQRIDTSQLHRRVLRPWQATYWKTLPEGHLVSYRFEEIDFDWDQAPHWFMELHENRWYRWS
ncbi:MAG TPA: hypothetical protein VFT74_00570 [Isosphaeraceae bacterium]|nr:hypothetical protein [Isosphaeraceae bacterium]